MRCKNCLRISHETDTERPHKGSDASSQHRRGQSLVRRVQCMRDKQVRPKSEWERKSERGNSEQRERRYTVTVSDATIVSNFSTYAQS